VRQPADGDRPIEGNWAGNVHSLDLIPRAFDHCLERAQCEKAEMRPIQDSALSITEPPKEKPHAHGPVGDVWDNDHGSPVKFQEWTQPRQHCLWIAQVFENACAEQHIKTSRLKIEMDILEIAQEDPVAVCARRFGSLGVSLNPDDPATALSERAAHVSGRASEFEHTLIAPAVTDC